jgi:FtsP/CotA-like multicopper oxidase with cupredoxin domain
MVRIGLMTRRNLATSRRALLLGLGSALLAPAAPRRASAAEAPKKLLLRAAATKIALRPGQPETSIWSLEGPTPGLPLRVKRGDRIEMTLQNDLPARIAFNLRGLDGALAAEPLAARPPLAPGANAAFGVSFPRSGSLVCDIRLLADGSGLPSRALPLVVEDAGMISDRDEVFLVEDWRLQEDGTAVPPGTDARGIPPLFTVNGRLLPEFALRSRERLRVRFINGCQRQVIALKIEGYDVRVMALDSQPSEPFLARNSALVLAPDGRADALIDVTPSQGSTATVLLHDGKEARPVALPLAGSEWVTPATFGTSAAPAFRAKTSRIVVLALINRAATATVFHLHGHHFRLLDRLDDGWKPYWLDTLAVEPGQTERIAFSAEYAGRWLVEATATDWAAPKLLRWYSVD